MNLKPRAAGAEDGSQGRARSEEPLVRLERVGALQARQKHCEQFCRTFSAQLITHDNPGASCSRRSHLPLATICPRLTALRTLKLDQQIKLERTDNVNFDTGH